MDSFLLLFYPSHLVGVLFWKVFFFKNKRELEFCETTLIYNLLSRTCSRSHSCSARCGGCWGATTTATSYCCSSWIEPTKLYPSQWSQSISFSAIQPVATIAATTTSTSTTATATRTSICTSLFILLIIIVIWSAIATSAVTNGCPVFSAKLYDGQFPSKYHCGWCSSKHDDAIYTYPSSPFD